MGGGQEGEKTRSPVIAKCFIFILDGFLFGQLCSGGSVFALNRGERRKKRRRNENIIRKPRGATLSPPRRRKEAAVNQICTRTAAGASFFLMLHPSEEQLRGRHSLIKSERYRLSQSSPRATILPRCYANRGSLDVKSLIFSGGGSFEAV